MQIIHRHPSDLVWFHVEWFSFEWIALVWSLRYNWFVGVCVPPTFTFLFYSLFLSLSLETITSLEMTNKSVTSRHGCSDFFFFFSPYLIEATIASSWNLNSCWLTDIHLAIRFNVWPSFHLVPGILVTLISLSFASRWIFERICDTVKPQISIVLI